MSTDVTGLPKQTAGMDIAGRFFRYREAGPIGGALSIVGWAAAMSSY